MDSNSLSAIDNYFETKELTGYEPVLGGELTEKAVWVDESRCIGCRYCCLLYTSPSPRDVEESRMPSSA